MKYTLDGIDYDDDPDLPTVFEMFLDRLGRYLLTFIDEVTTIPPLSWLDRILSGPVGPSK